jgi:hypothetical protein
MACAHRSAIPPPGGGGQHPTPTAFWARHVSLANPHCSAALHHCLSWEDLCRGFQASFSSARPAPPRVTIQEPVRRQDCEPAQGKGPVRPANREDPGRVPHLAEVASSEDFWRHVGHSAVRRHVRGCVRRLRLRLPASHAKVGQLGTKAVRVAAAGRQQHIGRCQVLRAAWWHTHGVPLGLHNATPAAESCPCVLGNAGCPIPTERHREQRVQPDDRSTEHRFQANSPDNQKHPPPPLCDADWPPYRQELTPCKMPRSWM